MPGAPSATHAPCRLRNTRNTRNAFIRIKIRPLPIYSTYCSIIVHAYFIARATKSLNALRRRAKQPRELKRICDEHPVDCVAWQTRSTGVLLPFQVFALS